MHTLIRYIAYATPAQILCLLAFTHVGVALLTSLIIWAWSARVTRRAASAAYHLRFRKPLPGREAREPNTIANATRLWINSSRRPGYLPSTLR